jgi:hypothetical protein
MTSEKQKRKVTILIKNNLFLRDPSTALGMTIRVQKRKVKNFIIKNYLQNYKLKICNSWIPGPPATLCVAMRAGQARNDEN